VLPLLRFTRDLFEQVPSAPTNSSATVVYRHPQANREVLLDQVLVGYVFARGARRTIGMVVGAEGLSVRAPRWTPLREVDAALKEKANWIVRKLQETRERHARQLRSHIEWRDGAQMPYLGGVLRVVLNPANAGIGSRGVFHRGDDAISGGVLTLGLPASATPAQIRDATHAWVMRQATQLFTDRLNHFAPLLGVRWLRLSLSNASTRWGSARVDGAIRLNWRLMHYSPAVIDYVVAHELSHLRVMDHSPQFWAAVETVVPDYRHVRKALKGDAVPQW